MSAFDFLIPSYRTAKSCVEIYPKFKIIKSRDLMVRGGDFYAVWDEEQGLWSVDEQDAVRMIDREIDIFADDYRKQHPEQAVKVLHMWDADSGMIDKWHKYVKLQTRENFHSLDEKLIFSNDDVKKEDYASRRLPYPLQKTETPAYDKLIGVLYSPEERAKLEWAIGAVISGDSKHIQKFIVLYGPIGSGKSTVIDIMELLFEGYYAAFDAKTLGSSSNSFALEAFRSNPLVAIQHDGDLSRIEDNTRINSLVSHEKMTVNEKFKSAYSYRFNSFLIMGTNKPVRITDAKSGIIRRLIDVSPTGNKVPRKEYDILKEQIRYELGGIAFKCLEFYNSNKDLYSDYIPLSMIEATNDFYNYMLFYYDIFREKDGTTQKDAWEKYNRYAELANMQYKIPLRVFKEEMKSYFHEFYDRYTLDDGTRVRSYYKGLKADKFEIDIPEKTSKSSGWLTMDKTESLLDILYADCPAQLANNDRPAKKWADVTTALSDICTTETHYVRPPQSHIVLDFDIPDENGNDSLELNIREAEKFPPTYAELSKSGKRIHLHYIWKGGDVSKLAPTVKEHVEIKVFTGYSSLRRKLSFCNDIPVAELASGLPLRKERKMVDFKGIEDEKHLRALVKKNLNKEIVNSTKQSIDLIVKDLDTAYASGIVYDISDLRPVLFQFAASSTHNADYCIKQLKKMKLKSADNEVSSEESDISEKPLVFFDWEVYPNWNCMCWKLEGDNPVIKMQNPTPVQLEDILHYRLVGFNCRRYDNHILYAAYMGYTPEELYSLSQRIIIKGEGFFGEAYNLSYTDIYDFSSKKQSLKKFEIELGIHHQEMSIPWDKPIPNDMIETALEYCANDVIATEAVFSVRRADFIAREILADVAGMTVNDTTNTLTTRIIFGKNKNPQSEFNYRNMGDLSVPHQDWKISEDDVFMQGYDEYTVFDDQGRPLFPGYLYENGVSTYRGEEVGEGGYVYAEPGIHQYVALLDITSMHPSSIIAENLFGDEYTKRFKDILDARVAIKHKDFDKARIMLGGALAKYLDDESKADDLSQALKIAINSVYGLTSAGFKNPFRDIRNIDNIVAKRGALFMINLKHEVQKRGFTVAHIKTDSIKIPNATNDIIKFVQEYGKLYGYNFEHEATYHKMCLVNNAVYAAMYEDKDICEAYYGYVPEKNGKKSKQWTATGTQFQVPYVFKTLFAHDSLIFSDFCETKSVSSAMYLDMNESLPEDEHNYIFVGKVGSFCPIKEGHGGGLLVRESKNKNGEIKYDSVTGCKDYRWLEAETVRTLGYNDLIDISYYDNLVYEAKKAIGEYGDAEWFCQSDIPEYPPDWMYNDVPF